MNQNQSQWYKIENKSDIHPTVYLYDEVGGYGIDAKTFVDELNEIQSDSIDVHINSVGGEVFQGFAIYQALKDHPANINVMIDGLAASIASVIAQAGDKITITSNGQMMIHDGMSSVSGNAADLTRMVDMLDRCSNSIASVYSERCGGEIGEWRNAMKAETWYNAHEAVEAGLADEVAPTSKRSARNVSDLRVFNYAGREFAPAPSIKSKPTKEPEFVWDGAEITKLLKGAFNDD